jgi:hypothetical protein
LTSKSKCWYSNNCLHFSKCCSIGRTISILLRLSGKILTKYFSLMKPSLASKVIYYSPIGRLSKTTKGFSFFVLNKALHLPPPPKWRHDIQHNDTQHSDIQHNDIQHDDICIMTFGLMTFSIIMTFCITTLSTTI